MNTWLKRLTVAALAAVMILTTLGTAAAQGPGGGPETEPPIGPQRPGERVAALFLMRLHDATGFTLEDLQARREEGLTIADLYRENGLDPDAAAEEVKTQISAEIEQAVADGRLTQEQADRFLSGLDEAIEHALNSPEALAGGLRGVAERVHQARERAAEMLENSLVGTVAEMSGADPREIVQAWREAGTLSAVIEAHGLSVDDVVSATEAKITEKVNEAVSKGRLSEEQATQALDGLHDRLTERVDGPFVRMPGEALRERVKGRAGELVDMTLVGVLAEMAGVDVRDLFTPPTLAEIAAERGIDTDAVVSEAEARITERVNQWVEEGKLTEEQAAQILDGLHDRLAERMSQPIGMRVRPEERISRLGPQNASAQQAATE